MTKTSKRKARRIDPKDLEPPTPEGHRAAQEAMKPFLSEFQAAADEQTKRDLGVDMDAPPAPRPTPPTRKKTRKKR